VSTCFLAPDVIKVIRQMPGADQPRRASVSVALPDPDTLTFFWMGCP
jgi:hypothetical protein